MSNVYRWPTKVASYQVSIHLAKWFQRRRFFRNQSIRNKNCLWHPCLLMDRDEMSNLYRARTIDASYQDSVQLAEGFQRRRLKCEKLTDDRCQRQCELKKKKLKSTPPWSISINSIWGKYVFCMQTVMSLWNHYLASDNNF